jgi:predicted transcriptional regulator
MAKRSPNDLSRRERQIMDIIYQRGRATATEVMEQMPEAPGYSAVRAMLRVLEDKGHLRHQQEGQRYIFLPTLPRDNARRSALRHLMQTFFEGSKEKLVAALLDDARSRPDQDELDRMARLIEQARKEGR